MPVATIEQAVVTALQGMTAVTAITSQIRPMKFAFRDDINSGPGVLVFPEQEDMQVDLSGRGGAESMQMLVRCASLTMIQSRNLAEACRNNGTNPGTGLEAFSGTVAGMVIQMITIDTKTFDFIFFGTHTDEGYYVVDLHCTVDYSEQP